MSTAVMSPLSRRKETRVARKRKKPVAPEETGQEDHNQVRAARMGWGRLDPPDLADAVVMEVLLRHVQGPSSLVDLYDAVRQFSEENQIPLFDYKLWCLEVRVSDLQDRGFIGLKRGLYGLTREGRGMFGEGNLSPQRGPRHAVAPTVYRAMSPSKNQDD